MYVYQSIWILHCNNREPNTTDTNFIDFQNSELGEKLLSDCGKYDRKGLA